MSNQPATSGAEFPRPLQAWYTVGVLLLALIFAFIDRNIMSLLVVPIKRDLMLSDTQFSLLAGFAFSLFYASCGIPIARLGDRKSRRGIVAIAITIWCVMTAVCGTVKTFWQLFAARLGVGVGEGALTPQASSIISDSFPRERLPLAFAVFHMGPPLALGLSFMLGGILVEHVSTLPAPHLPVIGQIYNWQLSFFIVGVPGLAIAALIMLTVREPARHGIRDGGSGTSEKMPIREVIGFWLQNWQTFTAQHLGGAMKGLLATGTSVWMPAFFMRTYGWTVAQAGLWYGGLTIVFAPLGMLFGGWLAGWLERRGYTDANMRTMFYASLVLTPATILFPLMPSPYMALVLILFRIISGAMSQGPNAAILTVISPNQIRGQITAFYFVSLNLIGLGMGPTFVALITDYVFHDEALLRYSMSITAALAGPFASWLLYFGLKHYRKSVERAQAWTGAVA